MYKWIHIVQLPQYAENIRAAQCSYKVKENTILKKTEDKHCKKSSSYSMHLESSRSNLSEYCLCCIWFSV